MPTDDVTILSASRTLNESLGKIMSVTFERSITGLCTILIYTFYLFMQVATKMRKVQREIGWLKKTVQYLDF